MTSMYLQRRYLLSFESRKLPHIFTDVLVIGSGAAGLRAAIEAAQYGQVIVTAKTSPEESNTAYAQGGLAAVLDPKDSFDKHIADTIATGCGLGDEAVIRLVVHRAPVMIEQLRQWGMHFDMKGSRLSLGREGGHSANRIVHSCGDATGKALAEALLRKARQTQNIKTFDNCFVIDLLTDPPTGGAGAACVGALTFHPRYGLQVIRSRQTILAAGAAGSLWRETTNPTVATADAMAMAFRAGVTIADAEMMQFHPTTLYVAGATRSLISEAVRGEGALLLDRTGKRFMLEYDKMGELAPRDIVSRAIHEQMAKTNSTHVFLDVRHMGAQAFSKRFPQIDAKCRSFGLDPSKDLIPVHPAAHYMIGGAKTDIAGRTSLDNLYACGEAACTGLHGANRLASNSLTEALVFGEITGREAGQRLAEVNDKFAAKQIDWSNPVSLRTELDLTDIRNSLRSLMWRNVGIIRNGQRLTETLDIISFWQQYVLDKEFMDPAGWEVQNMLTAAHIIVESALRRTETRGVHYREDFNSSDSVWQRHQFVRRSEHQLIVE
ncbi:MAG: L-aspartate oxidase [Planctomycetes bacterium]|nr:L-aspartate oxidase [Planctomycetota bacterium]